MKKIVIIVCVLFSLKAQAQNLKLNLANSTGLVPISSIDTANRVASKPALLAVKRQTRIALDSAKAANAANYNSLNNQKQANLVSGTNIKTVNGTPIVGSGNVVITGGLTADQVKAKADSSAAAALLKGKIYTPYTPDFRTDSTDGTKRLAIDYDVLVNNITAKLVAAGFTKTTVTPGPVVYFGSGNAGDGTSGYFVQFGYPNAFDTDDNSFFASDGTLPAYVGVDAGQPKTTSQIWYKPRRGAEPRSVGAVFQGSADNVTWVDLYTITTNPPGAGINYQLSAPVTYRYWRLIRTAPQNGDNNLDVNQIIFYP